MKKAWSDKDLIKLEILFNQKKSLQQIAIEMNRSKTAINKALTRYKIRKRKYCLDSKESDKFLNIDSVKLSKKIWVSIKDVINFLESAGYKVQKNDDREIFLEREYKTYEQLLIIANKERGLFNLPSFLVDNITC